MTDPDPGKTSILPLSEGAADEALPFQVELWKADRTGVERVLARAASSVLAQAIFSAAKTEYPGRHICVRRAGHVVVEGSG